MKKPKEDKDNTLYVISGEGTDELCKFLSNRGR